MQFLTAFMSRFGGAVMFLGGCMVAYGIIQIALASREGFTSGGAQIAGAIGTLLAGALICVASGYFMMLDTSWAA